MHEWQLNPNVVLREESDQWGILFDPDTGNSLVLNAMAVDILKRLPQSPSLQSLSAELRCEYEDVPNSVESDISTMMAKLSEAGFVGSTPR